MAQFGTAATTLSSHTNFDIIKQNYLDQEVMKEAQKDFSVFGNLNNSVPQNSTTASGYAKKHNNKFRRCPQNSSCLIHRRIPRFTIEKYF